MSSPITSTPRVTFGLRSLENIRLEQREPIHAGIAVLYMSQPLLDFVVLPSCDQRTLEGNGLSQNERNLCKPQENHIGSRLLQVFLKQVPQSTSKQKERSFSPYIHSTFVQKQSLANPSQARVPLLRVHLPEHTLLTCGACGIGARWAPANFAGSQKGSPKTSSLELSLQPAYGVQNQGMGFQASSLQWKPRVEKESFRSGG